MSFTADQLESLRKGEPVQIPAPELGEDVVLIRASQFAEFLELLADAREKEAWAKLARAARDDWARDNPY